MQQLQHAHLLQCRAKAGNIPGQQAHSRPLQLWRPELCRVQHCIVHCKPQAACCMIPEVQSTDPVRSADGRTGGKSSEYAACKEHAQDQVSGDRGLPLSTVTFLVRVFLPPGAVTSVVLSSTVTCSPSVSIDVVTICCSTFLFRLQTAQPLASHLIVTGFIFAPVQAGSSPNMTLSLPFGSTACHASWSAPSCHEPSDNASRV